MTPPCLQSPRRQPRACRRSSLQSTRQESPSSEEEVDLLDEHIRNVAVPFSLVRTDRGTGSVYITEPFEPPPASDFVLVLMANQIDPQQLLQTIQALGAALDTTRLAVDTHIAAQAQDMARMATQITNLTTQVGTVSTDMQAIAQQLTTANQNRPESYVNSAPEWDGSGKSQEARHFLAAFANWASSSGGRLNNWRPPVGNVGDPGYVAGRWEGDGGKWT